MRSAILAGLVLSGAAAAASAADFGAAVVVGAPRGALGQEADVAGGVAGHALLSTPSGTLALRLDGSWLLYGSETVRLPVARTAGRIVREVTTDNWVGQLGLGPQLSLRIGGLRPYAGAFAGLSYLSTTSHLRDPSGFVSRDSTNYDDTGFAWGGGGGVLVPLGRGATSLDVGLRYVRTGTVRFLGEGDLVDDGTGAGVVARPHRGQANVVEFRLGVVFSGRPRSPRP